ncbi:Hypothetical protein A7982_03548 [Minicystis rosea]|nr:Hypothetical protein A7982_03548 [Minicystis rosea]
MPPRKTVVTKKARVRIDLQARLRACGFKICAVTFDRAGERLAFACLPAWMVGPPKKTKGPPAPQVVRVWIARVRDGAILHELVMPTRIGEAPSFVPESLVDDEDIALDFSPDGAWLAVSWNLESLSSPYDEEVSAVAVVDLERGAVVASEGFLAKRERASSSIAFSQDSRVLVYAPERSVVDETGVSWLDRTDGWKNARSTPKITGDEVAFSADGKRLITITTDSVRAVTFVRAGSRVIVGRSKEVAYLSWPGPWVVTPDGTSAIGLCSVGLKGKTERDIQEGVWRWRKDAAPELVALVPMAPHGTSGAGKNDPPRMRLLWIEPEGRELLWVDEDDRLWRQRVGQRRLTPIRSSPSLGGLPCRAITRDGKRIARIAEEQVVITRLRRRPQSLDVHEGARRPRG